MGGWAWEAKGGRHQTETNKAGHIRSSNLEKILFSAKSLAVHAKKCKSFRKRLKLRMIEKTQAVIVIVPFFFVVVLTLF